MIIPGTDYYLPDSEIACELFAGSSGPGGQNVNKVATAVRLRLRVATCSLPEYVKGMIFSRLASRINLEGELVVEARVHRTQGMNREEAMSKLEGMLRGALVRQRSRVKTIPTAGSVRRRLNGKSHRAQIKKNRLGPEAEE